MSNATATTNIVPKTEGNQPYYFSPNPTKLGHEDPNAWDLVNTTKYDVSLTSLPGNVFVQQISGDGMPIPAGGKISLRLQDKSGRPNGVSNYNYDITIKANPDVGLQGMLHITTHK